MALSTTQYGHVWSTSPSPTIALPTRTELGTKSTTGAFTSSISNLQPSTIYYIRSYTTTQYGTTYGNETTFTALSGQGSVTTTSVARNGMTAGTADGNITSFNGMPGVDDYGHCWSTSKNPTTANSKTTFGAKTTLGTYTSTLTGLSYGTVYYVRAYTVTQYGTFYGGELNFMTALQADTYGHVWGTSSNPTTALSTKTTFINKSTIGSFVADITGLVANTTYYLRSYTTNKYGTSYGNQTTFTTKAGIASLTNGAATSIANTTATLAGTITNTDGETITDYGHVWATTPNPTTTNSKTSLGSRTTTGSYTSNATGMLDGQIYYYRPYAITQWGTSYGDQKFFTTKVLVTAYGYVWSKSRNPTVALTTKTDLGSRNTTGSFSTMMAPLDHGDTYYVRPYATTRYGTTYGFEYPTKTLLSIDTLLVTSAVQTSITTATLNGNLATYDGLPITAHGFCWSTSASPTTVNSKNDFGARSIAGTFTYSPTGLTHSTLYYVRAYITNQYGTYYSKQAVFTTKVNMLEHGFVYSESLSPTIIDTKVVIGQRSSTGTFNTTLPLPKNGTLYHVRSYATTNFGTTYGPEKVIKTLIGEDLSKVTSIGAGNTTTATFNASIDVYDGNAITAHGFCWSTSPSPTTASSKNDFGTRSTTGTVTYGVSGLRHSTQYYVRFYIVNQYGTHYSKQTAFTTKVDMLEHGFATSQSLSPTTANAKLNLGNRSTTGTVIGTIPSLISGTFYHTRPYATTDFGTTYGPEKTFTTLKGDGISRVTSAVQTGTTTATLNGSIDLYDSNPIIAHGFCWGTSPNPTTANSKNDYGARTSTGTFTLNISGLSHSTLYYVCFYVTNANGTYYSKQAVFTTKVDMVEHGFVFSQTLSPTTANIKVNIGNRSSTGTFTAISPTLNTNTLYHMRPYSITNFGTTYGTEKTFTTLDGTGATSITSIASISYTTATLNGSVDLYDGNPISAHGFCWSTNANPTTAGAKNDFGTRTATGIFTYGVTGLLPGTLYYVRLYITNQYGTFYSKQSIFTTTLGAIDHGFVWAISASPTTANGKGSLGIRTTTGVFTGPLSPLNRNTLYYTRPFVTTGAGTVYGTESSFTTPSGLATMGVTNMSSIGGSSASAQSSVGSFNGGTLSDHGFVWSTTSGPTTALTTKVSLGSRTSTGNFASTLSSLAYSTTYYVRSYGITEYGTTYGTESSFSTLTGIATVTTEAVTNIVAVSAVGNGTVTGYNGENITQYGHCWSTAATPTTADSKTMLGARTTTGTFTSSITGLSSSTIYNVRSYVTTPAGTSYGAVVSFTTQTGLATVSQTATTAIVGTSATANGSVDNFNGGTVSQYGHIWSTTTNPTIVLNTKTQLGSKATTGVFTSNMTGLQYATMYYTHAYATTEFGTTYSSELSFTTKTGLATVTTGITSVTAGTNPVVTVGGNVTALDGENITAYGHVWSTSTNPTIALGTKTNLGTKSTIGAFTSTLTGLAPITTYYTRAYTTTLAGTTYGSEVSFTTLKNNQAAPATPVSSSITATSMVWTSSSDALITVNGQLKASGSTWTGLTHSTRYTAVAYRPSTTTLYQSPDSTTAADYTLDIPPTLTIGIGSKNTQSGYQVMPTITDLGGNGLNIIEHGLCWSTSPNPTTSNTKTTLGPRTTTGSFTSYVTGLVDGVTYYVRAYATNPVGTGYSNEMSFTFIAGLAVVSLRSTGDLLIEGTLTEGAQTNLDGYGNLDVAELIEGNNGEVMILTKTGILKIKGELKEGVDL